MRGLGPVSGKIRAPLVCVFVGTVIKQLKPGFAQCKKKAKLVKWSLHGCMVYKIHCFSLGYIRFIISFVT